MPIRPFLSGEAFEPETIHEMSLALESVCKTLGLKVIDDPATRHVRGQRLADHQANQARRGHNVARDCGGPQCAQGPNGAGRTVVRYDGEQCARSGLTDYGCGDLKR
jgi:hypothetical protein